MLDQTMCSSCGCEAYVPLQPCPYCGRKDAIAVVTGVESKVQLGTVGAVAKRLDADVGTAEVTVHSAAGWNVLGSLDPTGRVEHQLVGVPPLGRRNEIHTAKTLSAALSSSFGTPASFEAAADDQGDDVVLTFWDGRRQAVQITMAISDTATWSALAGASQHVHRSTVGDLAEGLYRAIQAKAGRVGLRERPSLWLALDARLMPVASWQEVADEYLSRHQPPCEEFGFADVWVVGPTPSWCQSLCVSHSRRASP